VNRREFITLLGGGAAAGPLAARAQQGERVRRAGWLDGGNESDPVSRTNRAALGEALAKLGWIDGRNLKVDLRFGAGDANRMRASAAELVALAPDVIVTSGAAATLALQQATQTIPLVFTGGGDAVINGLVQNIARPEGNTTGFSSSESTLGGKWLELLKAAAPRLARVVIVFNPELARASASFFASIEPAAQTLAVQTIKAPFRDAVELVRSIDAFAAKPNGGLLLLPPPFIADRATVLKLAAQHRLPAIYPQRALAAEGGLISYGADPVDQYRRTASYVDRILRGAKIADLPVQFPTKFKLVVNLKTAKAIGLAIPEPFLRARADEVIE
jgi:putative tryptophan/tyrosine transport system substrate-binding protein